MSCGVVSCVRQVRGGCGMDRLRRAPEALEFLRRFDLKLPAACSYAAFAQD